MTLLDQIDAMPWADPDTERFARLIGGVWAPDLTAGAAELVVLVAAAWILASQAATPADLTRLHGELYEVSDDMRTVYGVRGQRPELRLVGGRDAG
ncbi:MAG: hypothetical protein Q8K20_13970 [Gemmobacter sp.]|nr:hypothetical protein [Gemmobacter sp.]